MTVPQAQRVRAALPTLPTEVNSRAARLRDQLEHVVPVVEQVIAQPQRRVLAGQQVPATEKLVSLVAPHTRMIPRRKGGAAVACGRLVVLDEVAGGSGTRCALLEDKTAAHGHLAPA